MSIRDSLFANFESGRSVMESSLSFCFARLSSFYAHILSSVGTSLLPICKNRGFVDAINLFCFASVESIFEAILFYFARNVLFPDKYFP